MEENEIAQDPLLPLCRNRYYLALERAFLNTQTFVFQEYNSNESIFLNNTKMPCNIDVIQRCNKKDIGHSVTT